MIGESILVGALVSGIVQWYKNKFKTTEAGTLLAVAAASLVFAAIGWVLQEFNLLQTFWVILGSATAIYAYIVKHLE